MRNIYKKDCDFCGRRIRMAEMENGTWLAFEIDGSGKHHCGSQPIKHTPLPKPPPTPMPDHSSLPHQHRPSTFEEQDKAAKMDRFCLWIIALAIFFAYFYFRK